MSESLRAAVPSGHPPGGRFSGPPGSEIHSRAADVLLVTCVKSKLDRPAAAKDLYTSPLFAKQRSYAERSGLPWFVLSAEHGLIVPDEWLAPYERYLPETPTAYRKAWGQWVAARLDLLVGPLQDKVIELHAGAVYADAVRPTLQARGAIVTEPLRGLAMGKRLAWYGSDTARRGVHRISL